MNLLSSVTKGFQMLNELLEDFKTSSGGTGGSGYDMMDGLGMGSRFGGGMPDDEDLMGQLQMMQAMGGNNFGPMKRHFR